jgi:hypothetical protein
MNIEKRVVKENGREIRSLILTPDKGEFEWLNEDYVATLEGDLKKDGSIELYRGGWIPCSVRLPETVGKYMVYAPHWGQITHVLWQGRWLNSTIPASLITHWREMLPHPVGF